MLAIKTLTATSRHGFSDADDRPPSASAPGPDLRRGRRRHRRARRRRRRPEAARRSGSAFQVLCITHLPQIAAYADTHFQIEKRVDGGRTRTTRHGGSTTSGARRGAGAHARRGQRSPTAFGASAREMLAQRGGGVARQAKAKGERRKRKAKAKAGRKTQKARDDVARKYLIETFGCQMNVHDSERMAGLLEQAGYEATDDAGDADVVVINTCSVRERAEDKLYTRLGELRAAGRRAGARSDRRGRRLRRAAGRRRASSSARPASPTSSSARRRSGACRCSSSRRPTRAPAARRPRPVRRCDVSARGDAAQRSVKAYVTIIEGCNEFCSFCVVPYTRGHERMRPKADILAEVREAAATRPPRGAAARPDRQPLRRARRSGVRLQRRCSRRFTTSPGIERIRFASPHPRHVSAAVPRRDGAAAEDLPAPAPAGAVGIDARARGDAAPLHARELSRSGRRDPRAAAGRGAVDRYDRRVPGRDRRGLRRHAVADRGGRLPQHVLVQVLAAAEHAGRASGCRTMCAEEEKTRRIVALQALQRDDSDRR